MRRHGNNPSPFKVVRMDPTGRIVSTRFPQALAATVAAALSLLPFAGAAQQSGLDRLIHRTTLENGLEVVVAENRAVPLATVLVAVRNGSFTQDTLEAGLALEPSGAVFGASYSANELSNLLRPEAASA